MKKVPFKIEYSIEPFRVRETILWQRATQNNDYEALAHLISLRSGIPLERIMNWYTSFLQEALTQLMESSKQVERKEAVEGMWGPDDPGEEDDVDVE